MSGRLGGWIFGAALAASRWITPRRPERALIDDGAAIRALYETRRDWIKQQAGVKTNKAFCSGGASISLELQNGIISLSPSRNEGNGNWSGLGDDIRISLLETTADAELGAAIRVGLEVSQQAEH